MGLLSCSHSTASVIVEESVATEQQPNGKMIMAYVTAWTPDIPNPAVLTHINYAFGKVNDTFDGVEISNPERFRTIASLKKSYPELKVLLSVGGWGAGGFSEMADSESNRRKFIESCRRIISDYAIDGIDLDWEYPGKDVAGISACERDSVNFTTLVGEMRSRLGKNVLLTIASAANARYVDLGALAQLLDFVNIMTYDMDNAPKHHSPLYRSGNAGELTCQESVARHLAAGVPAEKLVLGIPFYGRGGGEIKNMKFRDIKPTADYTLQFDSVACVPYMADRQGKLVLGYDDDRSVNIKCDFIEQNGLGGAMYWEYSGDTAEGLLRRTLAARLK